MIINIVLLLTLLVCLLVAVLLYYTEANFMLKLVALPFTIASGAMFVYTLIALSGAPIESYPRSEFKYFSHAIVDNGKNIILLAWPQDLEDFRLYKFPYDREVQKKLAEANKKTKEGKSTTGTFSQKKTGIELFMNESSHLTSSIPDKR